MATTEAVTVTEPLKYQTWNLKVSIHCEGCRRKVKKVLQSIEGVYTTNIDPKQHKVTVTGNVPAETLIKKLIKTGKQAQLWPEPPKKPNGGNPDGSTSKKKSKNKNKNNPNSDNPEKKEETEPQKEKEEEEEEDGDEVEEDSPAMEKKETPAESNNKTPPPKAETETPSPAAGKKKKKNKKGNSNSNSNGNPNPNGNNNGGVKPAAEPEEMKKKQAATELFSLQPPAMPAAAVPQYVVSYSTMIPPVVGSYYIPATTTAATEGSYDFFSEENANFCIVM